MRLSQPRICAVSPYLLPLPTAVFGTRRMLLPYECTNSVSLEVVLRYDVLCRIIALTVCDKIVLCTWQCGSLKFPPIGQTLKLREWTE